jgi:hypothetical protein
LRRGFWLSILAAVAGACVGLQAQPPSAGPSSKTMLIEPSAPLLPATLGKLKRVADGDVGDGLGSLDAAEAPVLGEDGLKRFARSDYAQGAEHGNVAVYQFIDASGAIAAYDYFRKPGMRLENMGDNAVSNADELLMRSGKNVVVGHFKVDHAEMLALTNELIDHLPKALGTTGIAPLLPTLLPVKGLDADSVKYALGPQSYQAMGGVVPSQDVGFDKSAEAVTAKYKGGGVLTLLLYPTPEIAGAHVRAIDTGMKQAGTAAASKLRREGPLVALATGAWPAGAAEKMVDGVHLRSEVTFDKPVQPEFHAEIRKTYTLLQSIAVFSGLGALAAVVLGLFLGFGRAGIRVLQGKPAATEPEFLRIDLSGPVGKNLRNPGA